MIRNQRFMKPLNTNNFKTDKKLKLFYELEEKLSKDTLTPYQNQQEESSTNVQEESAPDSQISDNSALSAPLRTTRSGRIINQPIYLID